MKDTLLHATKFIKLFHRQDHGKSWVFASRKDNPAEKHADAAVIVTTLLHGGQNKLVVTKEYRVPLGGYELASPAGCIERGEDPLTAARREFTEETGLTLEEIYFASQPTYSSAGLTDESATFVVGRASGNVSKTPGIDGEEIEVLLLSRKDCEDYLREGKIGISCRLWPILVAIVVDGKFGPLRVD